MFSSSVTHAYLACTDVMTSCLSRFACRRYIEEEAAVKKLYITDIETMDDGVYKCNATAAAGDLQPHEKTVALRLFSEFCSTLFYAVAAA